MSKKDYYEVLGVSKNATDEELKKAYRRLAKQHHPDANKDNAKESEAKFKEINEAYSVLGDKQKRTQYDQFGHGFEQAGFGGAGGFDWSNMSGYGNGGFGFDIDLEDILGSVFGGGFSSQGKRKNGPVKGADIRINMTITFEEAVFGTKKEIDIERNETCKTCHGSGAKAGTNPVTCDMCHGSGKVKVVQNTFMGSFATVKTCEKCNGTGQIIKEVCHDCKGTGRSRKNKHISINIPAGIDNGQMISLSGEGDSGIKGGPNGDVYVVIKVQPHKIFKRDGYNIYFELPITYTKATLGGHISIPTLEGNFDYEIPEGTQTGTVFKVRNKGIPYLRGNGRGELHFKVIVDIPTKLTEEQRDIISKLAISLGEEPKKRKGIFG